MRDHYRFVATLIVCLFAYAGLMFDFRLFNQPSDASVAIAIGLFFAWLLIVPVVIRTVWRRL